MCLGLTESPSKEIYGPEYTDSINFQFILKGAFAFSAKINNGRYIHRSTAGHRSVSLSRTSSVESSFKVVSA
jgi:hypothetical protein